MKKCMEIGKWFAPANRGGYSRSVDILKGIGIILMVLGHSGFPFTHFIYLFHMALFFMASGYCWNRRNSESGTNVKKYIIKQIRTLYIPYIVANIIYLLLNNFFLDVGLYTDSTDILEYAGADYEYIGKDLGFNEFIKELIRIILFMGSTQFGGATWFLRTLFFVKTGHCIFEFLIRKVNKNFRFMLLGSALIACCVAYELQRIEVITISSVALRICILGYITYSLGIFMKHCYESGFNIGIIAVIIAFICLAILNNLGRVALSRAYVPNTVYYIIASVSGWCLTIYISRLIDKTKWASIVGYLGQHTMPIVLLHFLCFKIVSFIYLIFENNMILLAYFPSLKTESWLWIFYTIVGISVPVILYRWYKKLKSLLLRVKS